MMGLPIDRLVVATNENDVLDEFFRSGAYRVRDHAHETSSPSMDISRASNFERFVFDLLGRDGQRSAELFGAGLARDGGFTLAASDRERIAGYGFVSGSSSHADRLATIRGLFEATGVLIDPHTADGLKVAREHLELGVPMIVLETAQPVKFAATIQEATGTDPGRPAAFADIETLPRHCTVIAPDVERVKAYIAEHATR
jgi:threonine synthase